jgi:hypothetical protein
LSETLQAFKSLAYTRKEQQWNPQHQNLLLSRTFRGLGRFFSSDLQRSALYNLHRKI